MATVAATKAARPKPPPGVIRRNMEEFGELTAFAFSTLRSLPSTLRYTSEVLRQMAMLVRGSTLFIAVMVMGIAFSATNFGYYFLKSAGAADYIGLVPGVAGPRIEAALLFGYGYAAKIGCGLVGELGSMKINEELDAYESEGISVVSYVVGTRVLASILFAPIITAVALVAATIGAYINAILVVHAVPSETFFRYNWANQAIGDQVFAFAGIFLLSIALSIVSCFYGLRAAGGPAGVGSAVARSLVINLVLVQVILGLLTFSVYGKDLGLPTGG
jgi:phospholipid/cholesterol/gamma-HCH transport system permease protein